MTNVYTGQLPDDGTGEILRNAFIIVNENFAELLALLDDKADVNHTHAIEDVLGLQAILDALGTSISQLEMELDTKANNDVYALITAINTAISNIIGDVNSVGVDISQIEASIVSLNNTINFLQTQINSLVQVNESQSQNISNINLTISEINNSLADLEAFDDSIVGLIENVSNEQTQINILLNGVTASIAQNDLDISALQAEQIVQNESIYSIGLVVDSLNGVTASISNLQAEQIIQNDAISALQNYDASQDALIAIVQSDVNLLEAEVDSIQLEDIEQNLAIAEINTAIAILNNTSIELVNDMENLQENDEAQDIALSQVIDAVGVLQNEVDLKLDEVTSNDGSVTIDLTDPNRPDLSVNIPEGSSTLQQVLDSGNQAYSPNGKANLLLNLQSNYPMFSYRTESDENNVYGGSNVSQMEINTGSLFLSSQTLWENASLQLGNGKFFFSIGSDFRQDNRKYMTFESKAPLSNSTIYFPQPTVDGEYNIATQEYINEQIDLISGDVEQLGLDLSGKANLMGSNNFEGTNTYAQGSVINVNGYNQTGTQIGGGTVRVGQSSTSLALEPRKITFQPAGGSQLILSFPTTVSTLATQSFQNKSGTIALLSDIPTATAPSLQDVTENGSTTDRRIISFSGANGGIRSQADSLNANTYSALKADENGGFLELSRTSFGRALIRANSVTSTITLQLPSTSGTFALLSDIPIGGGGNLQSTLDSGNQAVLNGSTILLGGQETPAGFPFPVPMNKIFTELPVGPGMSYSSQMTIDPMNGFVATTDSINSINRISTGGIMTLECTVGSKIQFQGNSLIFDSSSATINGTAQIVLNSDSSSLNLNSGFYANSTGGMNMFATSYGNFVSDGNVLIESKSSDVTISAFDRFNIQGRSIENGTNPPLQTGISYDMTLVDDLYFRTFAKSSGAEVLTINGIGADSNGNIIISQSLEEILSVGNESTGSISLIDGVTTMRLTGSSIQFADTNTPATRVNLDTTSLRFNTAQVGEVKLMQDLSQTDDIEIKLPVESGRLALESGITDSFTLASPMGDITFEVKNGIIVNVLLP